MPTPDQVHPHLIVGKDGVNVRTGPGLAYEKIGLLMPGVEADIVGFSGDWWAVEIDGENGWIYKAIVTNLDTKGVPELPAPPLPTPDPTATPDGEETPIPMWAIDEVRWIDVDLSEQRLTAYQQHTPIKSYLVSTGLPQTPTPIGQYRIWIKLRTDDMAGADYYIKDVPWVMYFHEGYGLHGVTWHANFGTQMSHGCVNQPNEMAEWLFNFASVGTLVNIHQ
jgi:lipoprotein-anchoring transpeptidase ErfK/SrfK